MRAVGGEQGGNLFVEVIHLHDWPAINVLPYSEISQRFEGALNLIEGCPEKLSKGVGLTYEKQFTARIRHSVRLVVEVCDLIGGNPSWVRSRNRLRTYLRN
jgi:hypothetical protein